MKDLFFLLSFLFCVAASSLSGQEAPVLTADDILIGDRKLPQVLLVGTFHFGYPNLDAHKVASEDQIDILSEPKQKEVAELVEYLARFRPTKIVVEAGHNSGYLLRRYERWQKGEGTLRAEEIDQLAFRLMERFGLDTLYGCDAAGLVHDMQVSEDSLVFGKYLAEVFADYDWRSDDPMDSLMTTWYKQSVQYSVELPLLEYFKYLNTEEAIRRTYGAYLIGDFKLGEFRGADALALYWYSRNLRIFRRIQQLEAGPDDRVLVLFGAGHIPILKEQFEASPEYEVVLFSDLAKD